MDIYRNLYQPDRRDGVRYCTGDTEGVTGRKGCGQLTPDGGEVCACGAPTRAPQLSDYIRLREGRQIPEEPEEVDADAMAFVSSIFANLKPDANGAVTLEASEALAVRKFYGLSRGGMKWWAALVRIACSVHNSAVADGLKVRTRKT